MTTTFPLSMLLFLKNHKVIFLITVIYFLLTILTTFPLIMQFTTHVAHDPQNDSFYCLWCLWWSKTALFDLHTNPLFTNYHFYPEGTSILFGSQLHGSGILLAPLQLLIPGIKGLIFTYNTFVFLSLVLSALGAYKLAEHVCRNKSAAFVAGIIYAFVPFRLFNMVRLQYFSLQWVPFFVLFFVKMLEEDKKRNPILAAIFFSLILFDQMGYAVHMVMFGTLLVLLLPLDKKSLELKKLFMKLALFSLAAVIITLPFTLTALKEMAGNQNVFQPGTFGTTLSGLIVPHPRSTLFGRFLTQPQTSFNPAEFFYGSIYYFIFVVQPSLVQNHVFIRYSVLLLFLLSAFLLLKFQKLSLKWIIIALFYFFMSIGPKVTLTRNLSYDIPTLYSLLSSILPLLRISRVTDDYLYHFTLAASVICAVGVGELMVKMKSAKQKFIFTGILTLVIIVEGLIVPLDLSAPTLTTAYSNIQADVAECSVAEAPIDNGLFLSRQFLFQTYHRKKLLGGLTVRVSAQTRRFLENDFIRGLQNPAEFLSMNSQQLNEVITKNTDFLNWTRLKYVVLNKVAYESCADDYKLNLGDLERFLELNGFRKTFEDPFEALFRREMTDSNS